MSQRLLEPKEIVPKSFSASNSRTKIPLDCNAFDALICDCDGTLVDTFGLYLTCLQSAFAECGLSMERSWYMARTGLSPEALLDAYEQELHPIPVSRPRFFRTIKESFAENLHTLREIAVVSDVVRELHGRVPMAVASNGERVNVTASLRAVGLLKYFEAVVTIEDVAHGKPEPDIYSEAARRLNTPPNRCFVLEDSNEGLRAARTAGMNALDIRPYLTESH